MNEAQVIEKNGKPAYGMVPAALWRKQAWGVPLDALT